MFKLAKLNQLIGYFEEKNPTVAKRIKEKVKKIPKEEFKEEKPVIDLEKSKEMWCAFSDPSLKQKIDSFAARLMVGPKITPEEVHSLKSEVVNLVNHSESLSHEQRNKLINKVTSLKSAKELIFLVNDLICKSTGEKVASSNRGMKKIAQQLVELGNELDETGHSDLANHADQLLSQLNEEGLDEDINEEPANNTLPEISESDQLDEEVENELDNEVDVPDYDELSIEEFKEAIEAIKFRFTDREKRERWTQLVVKFEKALKHLERFKELRDQVHSSFDEHEEPIRLKYEI